MHNAIMTLYEGSAYLYPVFGGSFDVEDTMIRNADHRKQSAARTRASTYLAKLGFDTYSITSFFGNFISEDPKSHWLRPAASYAIVERALADPKSAAAIAKRIWMSLVEKGHDSLTADDIAEVLGPYRRDDAMDCFKVIDENETGDIKLEEMILTFIETGRIRQAIYQSMSDIDHCLNTFDWITLLAIDGVVVFLLLSIYVDSLKSIQQTLSIAALGLSFATGRAIHHYLIGCVFVFFDHPFDVGDRVEVYNPGSTHATAAVVKRQSLLYTIFVRVDNGSDMQISNERLTQKRIENLTRSGQNKQRLSIYVDFNTSFKDIMYLRTELENFLKAPENRRDFKPNLSLSISNLFELNKMEIRLAYTHTSNWSNDQLKSARNNRFMCALVSTVRKIPINKPEEPGDSRNPQYSVQITGEEARKMFEAEQDHKAAARYDAESRDVDPPDEDALKRAKWVAAETASEEEAKAQMSKLPSSKEPDSASSTSEEVRTLLPEVSSLKGVRVKGPQGFFRR
jgi:hypothetical protein